MYFLKVELCSRFFLDMPLMDDIQNCAVHRNIFLKLPLPRVILPAYVSQGSSEMSEHGFAVTSGTYVFPIVHGQTHEFSGTEYCNF